MAIQKIETIQGGKAIPVKLANVKNADLYDIVFSNSGSDFKFIPTEGKLQSRGESKNNFTISENAVVDFVPAQTYYFGILEKGTKRMTKAEVDAYQATEAAKAINVAADAAVKSEKIKESNINRTALVVTGIVLLISGIAYGFYAMSKRQTA